MFSINDNSTTSNGKPAGTMRGSRYRAIQVENGFIRLPIPHVEGSSCTINHPRNCQPGLSVSVLAYLLMPVKGDTESTAAYLLSSGPPKKEGVSIYLKNDGPTNTTISFYGSDGEYFWLATAQVKNEELIRKWTQFGVSWHTKFGVWGLLDGIIVGVLYWAFTHISLNSLDLIYLTQIHYFLISSRVFIKLTTR